MQFDIEYVPFSRFCSYIAFSTRHGEGMTAHGLKEGLWFRCVHGDAANEVFLLEALAEGQSVPFEIVASPSELVLKTEQGRVRLCIVSEDLVRVRGESAGLRLTARPGNYNCAVPQENDCWLITMATASRGYRMVPLRGGIAMDAPWGIAKCEHVIVDLLPGADGVMEAAIEQSVGASTPQAHPTPYEEAVAAVDADFRQFVSKCGPVPEDLRETMEAAAYINWSTTVAPNGFLTRPAMFMSKNWMTNVWSWDHAFNALGLCYGNPQLAYDQFRVIFDNQKPNGQLPDLTNGIVHLYTFVKPPVHGWIFRKMMRANAWFRNPEILQDIYEPLCKWTEWWFTYRNPDGDGLPQYHHGNDSGWDNGTVFDIGLPVKGCDLAAFLVIQQEVLSEIAGVLGKSDDAASWARRADDTQAKLMAKMWRGDHFVCPSAVDGRITEQSDSIFTCLPVVLGTRLPQDVLAHLVHNIKRHLTAWGPATEHINSPLYSSDGYWRGPIWAPPTMIIADGLYQAGEVALAVEIARRFCNLCKHSGFAENFDAVAGTPLRDRAYTWTSSVFLSLAHELLYKVQVEATV